MWEEVSVGNCRQKLQTSQREQGEAHAEGEEGEVNNRFFMLWISRGLQAFMDRALH